MKLFGKSVRLEQLADEFRSAGVTVRGGLGTYLDAVFTYDEAGQWQELDPAARAVIDAHVPQWPQPVDVTGADTPQDQLQTGVNVLKAYLADPTPTNASTVQALRVLIRIVLFMVRKMGL